MTEQKTNNTDCRKCGDAMPTHATHGVGEMMSAMGLRAVAWTCKCGQSNELDREENNETPKTEV